MNTLTFNILKAGDRGRSGIEITLKNNNKKYVKIVENTDFLLTELDKVLKSAKLKIESLKHIKIKAHQEAGLTSQRITKAIIKALSFEL